MLTDSFINSCFSLILGKNTSNLHISVFRDIVDIVKFYKEKEKSEIPIQIKNKLEILEKTSLLRASGYLADYVYNDLHEGEKNKDLFEFIDYRHEEELDEKNIIDIVDQIRDKKKLSYLFSNYINVGNFIETVRNGTYNSSKELIRNYEKYVKELYRNFMSLSRIEEAENSSNLDLSRDEFKYVIDAIKKQCNREDTIKTGFPILDETVFTFGGLERKRLYILGGGSGSGKSTFLLNIIEKNFTKTNYNKVIELLKEEYKILDEGTEEEKIEVIKNKKIRKENKAKDIMIYITLENTIDESLLRLYQIITGCNAVEAVNRISSNPEEFENLFSTISYISNTSIILKYFPKYSITPSDVYRIIDDIVSDYPDANIKAIFLDYLDLLKGDIVFNEYRLELSAITSSLKDLAISYNTPLLTVTQLIREVYVKNPDSKSLNLGFISEAIKKVDHADFVALMNHDQVETNTVHMFIGKNRNGKVNIPIDFNIDFERYKFKTGIIQTVKERKSSNESNQVQCIGFDEFGGC